MKTTKKIRQRLSYAVRQIRNRSGWTKDGEEHTKFGERWWKRWFRPMVGCSLSEFKNHFEARFTDGMTWSTYGSKWFLDFVSEQAKNIARLENLQPHRYGQRTTNPRYDIGLMIPPDLRAELAKGCSLKNLVTSLLECIADDVRIGEQVAAIDAHGTIVLRPSEGSTVR